ncbi:MAG: hypothetical protein AAGA62_16640 [Bacteroidota bacterium]
MRALTRMWQMLLKVLEEVSARLIVQKRKGLAQFAGIVALQETIGESDDVPPDGLCHLE